MSDVALARQRLISRLEYESMVAHGLFRNERVELVGGVLLAMSPIGGRHVQVVAVLTRMLVLALERRAWVSVQGSYALDDYSEPEPDVAVLPAEALDGVHVPSQALLLIEVAESSLEDDRNKAARYASAGVPETWIVNLVAHSVEVYRQPEDGRYAEVRSFKPGARIALVAFPDVILEVGEILAFPGAAGTPPG